MPDNRTDSEREADLQAAMSKAIATKEAGKVQGIKAKVHDDEPDDAYDASD